MDSVSRAGGGLLEAERALHRTLHGMGVATTIHALRDSFSAQDLPTWRPLEPIVHEGQWPLTLGGSAALRAAINRTEADLAYRVGLWRFPSRYLSEWKRKTGRPEIIAPHGMLDSWAVRHSRWKKVLAKLWFEGAHLRQADCIRALCEPEARSIRAYGLSNPIAIIPNGVDLPEMDSRSTGTNDDRKMLLFLGRLHPKKGLPNALRAWKAESQKRKTDDWRFVIAGWGQGGHEDELKRLATELEIRWADVRDLTVAFADGSFQKPEVELFFTGPVFGPTKDQLLRQASAFILPSFSEGLPMAVLEAWAYGLPVLMTEHCNLPEGFEHNAAIRIGTDPESIAEGLRHLFALPAAGNRPLTTSLQSLGQSGRKLVESRFTWPQVARQMKELYQWVLARGDTPAFVEIR